MMRYPYTIWSLLNTYSINDVQFIQSVVDLSICSNNNIATFSNTSSVGTISYKTIRYDSEVN